MKYFSKVCIDGEKWIKVKNCEQSDHSRGTENDWVKVGSDRCVFFFCFITETRRRRHRKGWTCTSGRTWSMQSVAGVRGSPSPSRCALPEEGSNCGWFSSSSASGNGKQIHEVTASCLRGRDSNPVRLCKRVNTCKAGNRQEVSTHTKKQSSWH